MTADKPGGSAGPRSPRSPTRAQTASVTSQYSRAFQYHSMIGSESGSSSPGKSPPARPAGPRSPEPARPHGPGSSRTRYHTTPLPATEVRPPSSPAALSILGQANVKLPASPESNTDLDRFHAPYRPPEAVIEPPEEHPPGYTPGIVAEHAGSDDGVISPGSSPTYGGDGRIKKDAKPSMAIDLWNADVKSAPMDVDSPASDDIPRPQVGPGILPRRLLMLAHEHDLVQPQVSEIPLPSTKPTGPAKAESSGRPLSSQRPLSVGSTSSFNLAAPPSPAPSSASNRSLPDVGHLASLEDVWEALPGEGSARNEWFFCPTCWGWLRITTGRGRLDHLQSVDEWEAIARSNGSDATRQDYEQFHQTLNDKRAEQNRLRDVFTSRATAQILSDDEHHHFHEFRTLASPRPSRRIGRVEVDDIMNAFPHINIGLEVEERFKSFAMPKSPTRLYVSCSSDLWCQVDEGMIPGQLPRGLVRAFTDEKSNNPSAGQDGVQSVNTAWNLLATLLSNPLFKGQRGWVKLANPKFQKEIGTSMVTSQMLYHIGFACQDEADGLRVGPLKIGDEPSEEDRARASQMDRYMLRAWVEICLYLRTFQSRNGINLSTTVVQAVPLEDVLRQPLMVTAYPQAVQPYPDSVKSALHDLGVTKHDRSETVEYAYGLQITCDTANTPKYLAALEKVADAPQFGRETLQMRVATERSLDKYTTDDVQKAYDLIGYTATHAEEISVPPHDAPEDYVLSMHKKAVQAASSPHERQQLSRALLLLGRERGSEVMKRLGDSGQTLMGVDEAYAALSCPMDAVDDGLLMQYEMAVSEYPGKADHYKNCLEIIANAPGQERPGIKTFLETGSREPDAPPRTDIPVGLQNIGNTCYLNSILQYLYSIKPLRDAVISFEQDLLHVLPAKNSDAERSRRFVRQLRLLFLQLYKSELPSVRPDEELAYLAITRPEVDAIVEPEIAPTPAPAAKNTLDSIPDIPDIPDMPSPTSTHIASPESSPMMRPTEVSMTSISGTSQATARAERESSILGKRASEDRDDSSRSSTDHVRQKSEGDYEHIGQPSGEPSPMRVDDFELIPSTRGEPESKPEQVDSPSATVDLGHLDLKSPDPEDRESYFAPRRDTVTDKQPEVKYDPPSGPPPLPPRPPLAKKDTLNSGLRFGLQQDSAEVLINVLSQLELAFDESNGEEGHKGSNLIQSLFSCKYRQQIVYESPSTSPSKSPVLSAQTPVESVFVHPIIGVEEEGKDLSDCLAELYLKGNDIEYEGKKGYMMDLMDEFPDMLYIQMRRSQYDLATGRERKTNTHIPFGQTLSMGRFLVSAEPSKREEAIELTREMMRVRTRLHQLRNHKPLSIPDTFKHASSAMSTLVQSDVDLGDVQADLTQDLFDALNAESSNVEKEIVSLQESLPRLKERMDQIWLSDDDSWEYELVSVFMHRGKSSGSGHYWTYQAHLPDRADEFFKYNDETVTAVPSSEVLADRTGDDANPALLCYVRKGRKLIETLHREVYERERGVTGVAGSEGGKTQDGVDVTTLKVEPEMDLLV